MRFDYRECYSREQISQMEIVVEKYCEWLNGFRKEGDFVHSPTHFWVSDHENDLYGQISLKYLSPGRDLLVMNVDNGDDGGYQKLTAFFYVFDHTPELRIIIQEFDTMHALVYDKEKTIRKEG